MKDEEKELAQILAEIPWSAILIPLILALLVIAFSIVITVWTS